LCNSHLQGTHCVYSSSPLTNQLNRRTPHSLASLIKMFQVSVLRFMLAHLLLAALGTTAKPTSPEQVQLVCSGATPVGNLLSRSRTYYAVSDQAQNASGDCSCDSSTGRLDCKVAPNFPVSVPQGPAVCQPPGQTSCAVADIFLCQKGKLIGGLTPQGGFYVTGESDKANGYCQCDASGKTWHLRCPDYPTSASFKQFTHDYIDCSKKSDCSGL